MADFNIYGKKCALTHVRSMIMISLEDILDPLARGDLPNEAVLEKDSKYFLAEVYRQLEENQKSLSEEEGRFLNNLRSLYSKLSALNKDEFYSMPQSERQKLAIESGNAIVRDLESLAEGFKGDINLKSPTKYWNYQTHIIRVPGKHPGSYMPVDIRNNRNF